MTSNHRALVRRSAIGAPLCVLLAMCACGTSPNPSSFDGGGGSTEGGSSSGGSTDGGGASDAPGFGDGPVLGDAGGNPGSGAPTTCIVGSQGCLCDSTGGCAPGLTCTQQTAPEPSLCCNGTNCASAGGTIGMSCSAASGAPSCTPGITIPPSTTTTDTCGYPASSFVESTTICAINAVGGGGAKPAIVQVFYNDEHALTLGCATASAPVSPLATDPDAVSYPQTGDPACTDTLGRPLRPVLFVTDISDDSSCTAGDQQKGGPAYDPIAVFGTWKDASEDDGGTVGTPAMADPKANNWSLTTSADPIPASATACKEGYGAELRFEVGLISGHSYRLQVQAHDGDQNKGGDSGEACAVFCAGSGTLCDPGVQVCGEGDAGACPTGKVCVQGCCLSGTQ